MDLSSQNTSEKTDKSQQSLKNMLIMDFARQKITRLFEDAGIIIQGENDWDIQQSFDEMVTWLWRVLHGWLVGYQVPRPVSF